MREARAKARFGYVKPISAPDYKSEVDGGEGVFVVVFLFKEGVKGCHMMDERLRALAVRFPMTKFVKIVSTEAIPNYPDRHLPTLLIYKEGDMKKQIVRFVQCP
jgi:phosducin